MGDLVSLVSSSALARLRCRANSFRLLLSGGGLIRAGRRSDSGVRTRIPDPTIVTPIRGLGRTISRTTATGRKGVVASPVINIICLTPAPRTGPCTVGNRDVTGNSIIYLIRTVGLVGRVGDRFSKRVIRILIRGRRVIRCGRPLFHVIWWGRAGGVDLLDTRRMVSVVPGHCPVFFVSGIRRLAPNRRVIYCGGMAVGRPFFRNRFPKRPMVPNMLVIRTLTRTKSVPLLALPSFGNRATCLNKLGGIGFHRGIIPKSILHLRISVIGLGGFTNVNCKRTFINSGGIYRIRVAFVVNEWCICRNVSHGREEGYYPSRSYLS